MQLKLDELIRATDAARTELVDLEDLSDDELGVLDDEFRKLHDDNNPVPVVRKLHSKIEAEKKRRGSFHAAGQAISSLLNTPINSKKDSKDQ